MSRFLIVLKVLSIVLIVNVSLMAHSRWENVGKKTISKKDDGGKIKKHGLMLDENSPNGKGSHLKMKSKASITGWVEIFYDSSLIMSEDATLKSELIATGNASIVMRDFTEAKGDFYGMSVIMYDSATLVMEDNASIINDLNMSGNATASIANNAFVGGVLSLSDDSVINIYVLNFSLDDGNVITVLGSYSVRDFGGSFGTISGVMEGGDVLENDFSISNQSDIIVHVVDPTAIGIDAGLQISKVTVISDDDRRIQEDEIEIKGFLFGTLTYALEHSDFVNVQIYDENFNYLNASVNIDEGDYKKGVFSFKGAHGGLRKLEIDLNDNSFKITATKLSLAGMRSAISASIIFGAFDFADEVDEVVINKEKVLPTRLQAGVFDAFRVKSVKVSGKSKKKLYIKGNIAVANTALDLNGSLTIDFGNFNEVITLVQKKDSRRKFTYKKPKKGTGVINAVEIDLDYCTFKISAKGHVFDRNGLVDLNLSSSGMNMNYTWDFDD